MCCVCYGSQYGSIQRLNNWFSGSIHGTFWTFQYCRLLLSKRSSSPWRRGLGKSSEGSGRPFPGTIWELCDWRIQSKEGVRQEKKVGRREWKAPFFILSFTFSFKHLHIFFFWMLCWKVLCKRGKVPWRNLPIFVGGNTVSV